MENKDAHITQLLQEVEALKGQLYESNSIIDAIRDGAVDALVLNKEGTPQIYTLESADYTYRILIEKFGEGALSITTDGLILYCNDYFSQLANISSESITGSYLKSYFDDQEIFDELIKDVANGATKRELLLNIQGRQFPVNISLTNLAPTVEAIGVVITDLTEKKQHEETLLKNQQELELKVNELHATNTSLEQFIHVISHDLKEPLRKILMYISRLDVAAYAPENNPVGVIRSSALRLNSLVDDLVKYAFSSVKDDMTPIDLDKVLKEVKDDLEIIISENNATVIIEELPVVTGTKVQMRQVFSNLISNAIKYSKKDIAPQITISYEIANELDKFYYKINIQDNGIGMDKAHLNKIFTIFQRLHTRNEYSGNGIGLAICKKIMENHSGRIEVQSIPGNGSVFSLFFPINNL
ncbi:PAS domain S-box protein [Flavobacterium zepuense]|uniref:histidine kinase n=1 Tax=Flavobacterium zepuense TaxID=2593302 RepID=A0A552UX08_9FLAO|nr:ATP-binding protein [Flavobacterium zepuense]TRW22764.1 PAS domain S-box protein [Flavobacterium zepuense]